MSVYFSYCGSDKSQKMLCQICNEVPHKYKCPRCNLKTCSLVCVNVHKAKNECNGIRDKTAFVNVKEYTDSNLQSDYMYLEDVGRRTDNALRDKTQKWDSRPKHVHQLSIQARKRKIDLQIMPYPLTKRKCNKTYYDFKTKEILWMTEWMFPVADASYREKFNENTLLSEAIKKFIDKEKSDPVIRHNLQQYVECDSKDILVLMKVENRPASSPRYYELNLEESINTVLKNKTVIEFPTFVVTLPKERDKYTILEEEVASTETDTAEKSKDINIDSRANDNIIYKPKPVYMDQVKWTEQVGSSVK